MAITSKPMALLGAALVLLACVSDVSAKDKFPKVIETEYGKVEGVRENEYKLTSFFGIPYAAPPEKELRFRPPQAPSPWKKTRKCKEDKFFGVCPQFHLYKDIFFGREDCLYMNIYVPDAAAEGPVPVMFWIYGGGFQLGDENEFGFYRGKHLASKHQVIVVEHNYRLGSLGMLSMPEFLSKDNTTGNAGLLDQQFALSFVKRNIHNFGGDPNKIAIFGESAGGMSVCWHLVAPGSRGLFSAAIMESGTCDSAEFFISLSRSYTFSTYVIDKAKCTNATDRVDCMQKAKVQDLFMAKKDWPQGQTIPPLAPVMPWGPAIDGHALRKRPLESMREGDFANVPTIMGTNHDEGTILMIPIESVIPGAHLPLNEDGFNKSMAHFFNTSTAQEAAEMYPSSDYKSQDARVAVILRDFFFLCATRRALRAITGHNATAYEYQFNFDMVNWIDYDLLGDYHTTELPFVFDNEWPPLVHAFGPKEHRMSDVFTNYWSNMARYGDPNHNLNKDQAVWPRYNETTDMYMDMVVPTKVGSHLQQQKCDFWDTHYTKYFFG